MAEGSPEASASPAGTRVPTERGRAERQALDEAALTPVSRRVLAELQRVVPSIAVRAQMERLPGAGGRSLVLDAESPTGDPTRALVVWLEDGQEPSVGFGPWHTHARVWGAHGDAGASTRSLAELVLAIVSDRFVLVEDVGGEHEGFRTVVDLRQDDSLEEHLTSPYTSGRVRIKSWAGTADRELGVEDL